MGKKGGGGGGSPAGDKDAEAVKIVKKGDIRKAEDFFQMNGSCVNACNKKGQTVLMLSVEERMSDISEMLLSLGAKAAQKDRDGKTALHYCIMEEDDITAMDVVKYGGKLSAQDAEGETAIHLAARLATEGSQKIACVLMTPEEYEEEALSGEEEETHRHKVSMPVSNTDVINALRLKDENDSTVLHLAASEADCRELADFIIDKAQTVLGGSSDMLKLVDMKTARGTPFMQACSTGNTPIALKLLSLGASVTSSDEEGVTPLHEACMDGCLELVNAILDHKEPVDLINCQAEDGSTCLHYAAMNGHSSIVKKLVSFEGVNVDPTDAQDETPISLAWIQGKADIVEMLKNAGATTEGLTDDKKAVCDIGKDK